MPVRSLCIELAVKTVRITFALRTSLYSLTFVNFFYSPESDSGQREEMVHISSAILFIATHSSRVT